MTRRHKSAFTQQPHIALLGQAPFTSLVTNGGGGQARFGPIVINRWRADPTLDDYGQWIYVRDLSADSVWSAAHQPVCAPAQSSSVTLDEGLVTFERTDGDIDTRMEIAVASAEAAEIRRVTLTNNSGSIREIEITSCCEVAIATDAADRGHPVFSNLFVQTEWIPESNAILAMRRPRSALNGPVWCGQVLAVMHGEARNTSCETDRAQFIGRGRSSRNPVAMDNGGILSGRTGAVLDPVFVIRTRVSVPAGSSAEVALTTFMAEDREQALQSAARYSDAKVVAVSFESGIAASRNVTKELGIDPGDAEKYQELAGRFVFPRKLSGDPSFAREFELIMPAKGRKIFASSGRPFMLGVVRSARGLEAAGKLAEAHRYWQQKGLSADLVLITAGSADDPDLAATVMSTIGSTDESDVPAEFGRIFVLRSDQLSDGELSTLAALARMEVDCDGFDLERELESRDADEASTESGAISTSPDNAGPSDAGLQFFNGIGGFNSNNEYEIRLTGDLLPPAPWINVVANASGGFIAGEAGAGPTWAINSSQFRLTPWQNDPVSDRPGECIYLKDEETGGLWTPTPAPIREHAPYTVRHGAGYSVFEHEHDGIRTALRMGVPEADPVKIQVLTIANDSERTRRISITGFTEWVLGGNREATRLHVRTAFNPETGIALARNPLDAEFADQCAFVAMSEPVVAHTLSRGDFLGRNGTHVRPKWLIERGSLNKEEPSTDPCAALTAAVELDPGESRRIVILVGSAPGIADATEMVKRYRSPSAADEAIDAAVNAWRVRLSAVTVRTPEPSFDLMLNQWAFYQALSCRVWGRIALYQSSGAYGFRDQLQDVTAFVYAEPGLAREQIIRAASRQFEEGDVQHWWHPHSGRGIRTRFADDLVWLPFVVDHYLRVTHDFSVLDEETPYLSLRTLEPDEEELYTVPEISGRTATVFDHCVHALNRATTRGAHGLPLIGSGDWNDGMNRVGVEGRGESVWLGWFFIDTLRRFAVYADGREQSGTAESFRKKAEGYREAIETSAWDGDWYRRAYYDDGTPLGSHVNTECQIDSIAQSWSVISSAGDEERSRIAMESLDRRLVRQDAKLIMLLTPPFDRGTHDPGYIQGYLPGVRENGAQYTHAALWAVLATALQGRGDRAFELYQMINPITHADSVDDVATYKVEPFVVAADVYTAEGHVGRGGWTWYTGSASWLYRVGLEAILGFTKRGETIGMNPCIPATWKEFSLEYRHGGSNYAIRVLNPSGVESGVVSISVDGVNAEGVIRLFNDGQRHEVTVTMGRV